ncbi:MAG: methionyl-tRNA formyltransferase [Acidobacteriota bacterium]|nr:methionyl-tRNA formyltransferase [Acidobacteriota bacterium]
MRIVFLGTPAFAVPAFQILLKHSHEICAVFTQPDRPSGRGQKLQPSPIKLLALEHGIPVFQPTRIRNEENRELFENLRPDFIVVAAYGQILPGWLLKTARVAPVNVHASLLPRYRGAAPIAWAVLNGDSVTGVTIMLMAEGLDSGAICLQQEIPISPNQTAGELAVEVAEIGAHLLIRALDGLEKGSIHPIPQDESRACWAPRIVKEQASIAWTNPAKTIHNQIRGLNPWPIAHTGFRKEQVRIWRSLPANRQTTASDPCGSFLGTSKDGIYIQCGEGTVLEILEVQLPGKSRVSGRAFANGARLNPGELIFC